MVPYDYAKYLRDFESSLECNNQCNLLLQRTRWPSGFICPKCGHKKGYYLAEDMKYECAKKSCKRQTSATANTVFHGTRVELRKWFIAIYMLTTSSSGVSAQQLARQIGVCYDTALKMLRKLRIVMSESNNEMLPQALIQGVHDLIKPMKNPTIKAVVSIFKQNGVPKVNLQCQDAISLDMADIRLPETMEIPDEFSKLVASALGHFRRAMIGTYHRYSTEYAQLYADEFAYKFNDLFPAETLARLMRDICRIGQIKSRRNRKMNPAA